jgi:hypothetical protein
LKWKIPLLKEQKGEKEMIEGKIVYFDEPGGDNTEEVFRITIKRTAELGIKTVVIATASGNTGVRATEVFKGKKVVAVTLPTGFWKPNTQELIEKNRQKIIVNGGLILTTTPLFGGISRPMQEKFNTHTIGSTIAGALRLMGQGMKVAIEISVMAADAGLVRTDENIVAIAGTGMGVDYAIVLKPVNSNDFFTLKVREILCKPHF